MKHRKAFVIVAAALVTLVALPSNAQQLAYVTREVNLRAGPSGDFPVVAVLGGGVAVTVEGCLGDFRWCDVSVGSHRGWLNAGNIVYGYQGAYVPLLTYGAAASIGVISFSVGNYWDNYYRASAWYPQRQRWIERHGPGHFGHPGHFAQPGHRVYPAHPAFAGQFEGQSVFRPAVQPRPVVVVPAPRPRHAPVPGFEARPPGAHGHPGPHREPLHGNSAAGPRPPAQPKPHHGMHRSDGQH